MSTIAVTWVLALAPYIPDSHGFTKAMPQDVAEAIAIVADELPFVGTPKLTAKTLAYWTFQESSWRTNVVGDGGKSCGLGQTRCNITPKDALGQIRLMAKTMARSMRECPDAPFALYAGGRCTGIAAKISSDRIEAVKKLPDP